MGRAPCCDKANVKRGPWSPDEDATLKRYLQTHGTGGNWIALPQKAGLKRCGKSCRLRWLNYLRPDIKHGGFTEEEDKVIFTLYSQMGSRWSLIASHLPGRTDNDVKNYWNTKLKKKLLVEGKTSLAIKNNTEMTPAPCPSPELPKTETNSSLAFWDSLTQSSVRFPILSDVGFEPILNQTLCVEPVDLFSVPAGMMDVSDLGANLTSHGISDSSSLAIDRLPSNGGSIEHDGTTLMDTGFVFPYDPVNALLFEDKAGEVGSTCCPNLVGFGYAEIKHQQGQNHSVNVINQY